MKPAQREKLQAAADMVATMRRERADDGDIIAALVRRYGAIHNDRREPYTLRVAGVASSCTWSRDHGVLANWIRTATVRLAQANMA